MSIPGMQVELTQASSFELDGASALENIPLLSARPVREEKGSTQSNIGCGKEGYQKNYPTPLNAIIDYIEIKFASSDKSDNILNWYHECTNSGEREWKKQDISIKGFSAKRNVVREWEVMDCYPHKLSDPEYDAASPNLAVYTMQLKGSNIKKTK